MSDAEPSVDPPREEGAAEEPARPQREVKFQYSPNLPGLIQQSGSSLLVSTYQAGKLAVLSAVDGQLRLGLHNFERVMGVAFAPGRLAIGTREQVWLLRNAPDIAPQLEPRGAHDACFLARQSLFTGEIQIHEMAFGVHELWVVNTLFCCLCTVDDRHSFVPQWKPPFVSELAAEDRCHLNGMTLLEGRPRYATVLGQTDVKGGWREGKVTGGTLLEVPSGRVIATGFAMPHSPRLHQGQLWLLDSGRGTLVRVEPASGATTVVGQVPGYARGLACLGPLAAIGLSKIRETSTFGGVPIAEDRDALRCGVAFVELASGRTVATFEFTAGVEEIFDVQWLSGVRHPAIYGPHASLEASKTVWAVPRPTWMKDGGSA